MSNLALWLFLAGAVCFGAATWILPDWIVARHQARRQRLADLKAASYVEKPHKEVSCTECGSVSCLNCPGQGNRHDSACSHHHDAL